MRDFRLQITVRRLLLAIALVAGLSVPAFTQSQPPPTPTPAALEGFVPMSEAAPREELPATPLVFYAYAFVWLALIGYVFLTWRESEHIKEELKSVQRILKDGPRGR